MALTSFQVVRRRTPHITERDRQRFLTYINKRGNCWIWSGSTAADYGVFYLELKRHRAHRAAYKLFKGSIPKGLCVCHTCDTPLCCNPEHLFLGTHAENMRDRNTKGRASGGSLPGENNPRSKLREQDVLDIRERAAQGINQYSLAEEYGVSQAHISGIITRRFWKHI